MNTGSLSGLGWKIAALVVVCCAALFLIVGPGTGAPSPGRLPLDGTSDESSVAAFQAAMVVRHQKEDADEALANEIHLNGMEAGRAGFHLIRPPSDPRWSAGFGRWQPTLNYRWYDVPVQYDNIEYQRLLPESIHPLPMYSPTAVVSQARVFANALSAVSIEHAPDGSYEVRAFFNKQSVVALQKLLGPTSAIEDNVQSDWYYVDHPVGDPVTPMTVALASDDKLYLPISVQQLIQVAGTGGATVVAATGLTQVQANELIARYNTP